MPKPTLQSQGVQKILTFMRERGERGATTAEISQATGLMSVSTWLSHLRANGIGYVKQYHGRSESGALVWWYCLTDFFVDN